MRLRANLCLGAVALAVLMGAAPPLNASAPGASPPAASPPKRTDADVMRKLQIFLGTRGPLPASNDAQPASRAATFRTFIRSQMAQDDFYPNFIPLIANSDQDPEDTAFPFTLSAAKVEGQQVYFLDKPCGLKSTVLVKPWWDLAHPVRVCADSYRPDIKIDRRGGQDQFCEANNIENGEPICRCGEYLLNCARDEQQQADMYKAWRTEYVRTAQHVIQHNRPFSELLTMNETVRTDYGELFYARSRFFESGRFDYPPPREDRPATLRPRTAKDGATVFSGVLTTPHVRYMEPAPRQLVSSAWKEWLCTSGVSTNVEAHVLFEFGVDRSQLRQQEHLDLTTKAGCKECHARLEYSMRAMNGYLVGRYGMRYRDLKAPGTTTRFYVRNSDDMRAEGPATPLWIGQMIAKQPEFTACMTYKVEEVFFGRDVVPPPVHQRLLAQFRSNENLASLIEETAVARFVGAAGLAATGQPADAARAAR